MFKLAKWAYELGVKYERERIKRHLAIRMRYEMRAWQAEGFSQDMLDHHTNMVVARIIAK